MLLLLCSLGTSFAHQPRAEVNMQYMGIAGILALAQYFRATPPAANSAVSELKTYRNVRVAVGVGTAGLLATISDPQTRVIVTASGVAVGELARVVTSANPLAKVNFVEPLAYVGILTASSWLLNTAGNAFTLRW